MTVGARGPQHQWKGACWTHLSSQLFCDFERSEITDAGDFYSWHKHEWSWEKQNIGEEMATKICFQSADDVISPNRYEAVRQTDHGPSETENSFHVWRISVCRAGSWQERHHRGHQEVLQVTQTPNLWHSHVPVSVRAHLHIHVCVWVCVYLCTCTCMCICA